MVVIRCTQALLRRLKKLDEEDASSSTTALGDWYGHRIWLGRRHLLLFDSERSRLPVLLPIREADRLDVAFPVGVAEMLSWLGIGGDVVRREQEQLSPIQVYRTASRSVVSSINDFGFLACAILVTKPDILRRFGLSGG